MNDKNLRIKTASTKKPET